ncbi:type IV secretion system protein VirD4 [Rhizobiales bacterium GAS188]|nr:type IV secretion system protein VirD4 [Rhizobiales bacterium GAS188]
MLLNTIVHDLHRTCLRLVVAIAPLVIWYPAWGMADDLWRSLLISMQESGIAPGAASYRLAYGAWPTAALFGPALVMALILGLRRFGAALPMTAIAAVTGMAAATLLTGWHEGARLLGLRPAYSWINILRVANFNIGFASALGFLATCIGIRVLRGQPLRAHGVKPLQRAKTDTFGHAAWMPVKEASVLFDASREQLGGVVVGEAYRVDQDPGAVRRAFDPRNRATWGKGGTAPLLVFDLGWGGTHGLVFAGSGSYKTVSTCVPTLLTYRGPTVTLDPSSELAPMLTPARTAMGRRVISIDPASREGSFNALDWLDPSSALIHGDVRAVVDWICGEKPAATSSSQNTGKAFFEGRGKAMVEALLSDIVLDPELQPGKRNLVTLAARLALPEDGMREELDRIHEHSQSPRARHLAGQLMQLVAETFSGVYGSMSEQTEWLANPGYAALVSGSSFTTADLVAGDIDLFINIPMKVLEATPALARVVVGALLNAVYEADGHLPGGRVVFLLDEVARLGFMSSLARARDAGRKYGITLVMLYQSEGQLREQWGEGGKASWFESASWRAYAAIGSLEQARAVSEACGEHGVILSSQSTNRGNSARLLETGTATSGVSEQLSERGRRLATVSEILADTRADEQFVFVHGRKPLRCGRAIYFRRPEMVSLVAANRFAPRSRPSSSTRTS